jgi:Protein of unknown function DUF262/HNH endonuclease
VLGARTQAPELASRRVAACAERGIMFQPETEYDVVPTTVDVRDFHEYPELFVTRPPYQRKNVWSARKQQSLLDSLFRRYYIPRLVLREVRISPTEVLREVVDGQQRIATVQRFFAGELRLPESLRDLDATLPGCRYEELPVNLRQFVDKGLKYDADLIKRIDNPKSPAHQKIATEIFWRLQQGESLNFMEIAHARLSSVVRNFLVKYADDITFDFSRYQPVDANKDKHPFFRIIDRSNDRMQHLSLLGRLLLIERADGPTDVRDEILGDLIDETQTLDGVGNLDFENEPTATNLLKTLNVAHEIFRLDPAIDEKSGVKELNREYFIISVVMLVRHLRKYYAFTKQHYELFRRFTIAFHQRWKVHHEDDRDVLLFSDNRQQSAIDLENRDRVMRQAFFEFLQQENIELATLDSKRTFNEAERIHIYRIQDGLCQECLKAGLPNEEARVSWSRYQADHIIPWIKGGRTEGWNGQVLCTPHNASKGGR